MKHAIEYDCECETCKGTGLYVGMAERNGAAVVCSACKGTGKQHVKTSYNDFTGRKTLRGIKRVYRANMGIVIGSGATAKGGHVVLEDFGGMPYEDWAAGKKFPEGSEMRKFICPAWWYQTVDYNKKPDWDSCIGCGSFSSCDHFSKKEACWERWDKEQKKGKK